VYGTVTSLIGGALPPLKGNRTLEFTLENAGFAGGKYFISISLMSSAGVHLHDLPEACSFNIVNDRRFVGSVFAVPSVRDLGASS
jgi:ABC-2 type transport system ATP-binding protein